MMVRRTAICTRASLVHIVPWFVPVVTLVCWSVVKTAIIVFSKYPDLDEGFSERYSFDLSLNSSGVGALVDCYNCHICSCNIQISMEASVKYILLTCVSTPLVLV